MKVLSSVHYPGLFRLWNHEAGEVTTAYSYQAFLDSMIPEENDWDPGFFDWVSEIEVNFLEWHVVILLPENL